MSTLKFFYVFIILMPCIDKLQPNHTVIQIAVAKHIGAVTGTYSDVVSHLIIQGKAKIPDFELVPYAPSP